MIYDGYFLEKYEAPLQFANVVDAYVADFINCKVRHSLNNFAAVGSGYSQHECACASSGFKPRYGILDYNKFEAPNRAAASR